MLHTISRFCRCSLSKPPFRDRNRKLFDLTRPQARTFSVNLFPDKRKSADTVKQACHSADMTELHTQPIKHKSPRRECDRVAECLVSRRITAFLVAFAFCVYPFADIRPTVRVSLQTFAFKRSKSADRRCADYAPKCIATSYALIIPCAQCARLLFSV